MTVVSPALPAPAASPARRTLWISGRLPSGKKKADYAAPLAAQGIELVDTVSAGLELLVLADPEGTSAKALKARQLGVPVIGEEQLLALVAAGTGSPWAEAA